MDCKYGGKTAVIDSRTAKDHLRRRRKCLSCGDRYTTIELETDRYNELCKQVNSGIRNADLITYIKNLVIEKSDGIPPLFDEIIIQNFSERDQDIWQKRKNGETVGAIGRSLGLSRGTVSRILKKQRELYVAKNANQ